MDETIMDFIGIDGGLLGAICFYRKSNYELIKMPILQDSNGRNRINIQELNKIFENITNAFVTLEKAHPLPIKGSIGNFSTGYSFGIVEALLNAHHLPYQIVHSKTWQKYFFKDISKKDTKAASILIAKRLFPTVSLVPENCKKESDGYSDALLICEYGRKMYGTS